MIFNKIRKTEHYKKFHEDDVPWSEVVKVIFQSSKLMKKKDDKIEIETARYYILCEIEDQTLWVINAKRR